MLCSAHINFTNLVKALNNSCFHFLSKPISPSQLREAVANVFAPERGNTLSLIKSALMQGHWSEAITLLEQSEELQNGHDDLLRIAHSLRDGRSLSPETLSPDLHHLLVA